MGNKEGESKHVLGWCWDGAGPGGEVHFDLLFALLFLGLGWGCLFLFSLFACCFLFACFGLVSFVLATRVLFFFCFFSFFVVTLAM